MNDMNVMLQISTAQGPAECQMFARFVLQTVLAEAENQAVHADIQAASESKHGILSAVVCLRGAAAEALAAGWLGTLQWVCPSPLRKKHPRKNWYVGVFRLPDVPPLADNGEVRLQTCRAGGKGGQHVNKTESAVRATHIASGIWVRVESERSQHANKKQALALLAQKLAAAEATRQGVQAQAQHAQLYQLARGNPVRVFEGLTFQEKTPANGSVQRASDQ